jgi:hypothetical protein
VGRRSPRVRWGAAIGRCAPLGLAAALIGASSAAAGEGPAAGFAAATRTKPPPLASGALVVAPHAATGPVAVDPHHLVWESGPLASNAFEPTLHDRNLVTGVTRTLSSGVDPGFGLASTSHYVFYARSSGNSTQLVRASHRGTGTRVLTDALATPIASRGNVVAWGEQSGSVERVVAYGGAGTKRWVVARMPRCTSEGCYRLDTVTVTDRGVVFTRDGVGTEASFVVRRAFGMREAQSRTIRGDPQPNLVPSSSGALYYVLSRGWYRWDFGAARPRPVAFANRPLKQLIWHEGSRWYWVVRHGCSVHLQSTRGGHAAALAVPKRVVRLGPNYGPTCTELGALAWAGSHMLASWAIPSEAAEEAHNDVGLHGAIISARVASK